MRGNYDIVLLDTWIKGGDAFLLAEKFENAVEKWDLFLSEDTGFFGKELLKSERTLICCQTV